MAREPDYSGIGNPSALRKREEDKARERKAKMRLTVAKMRRAREAENERWLRDLEEQKQAKRELEMFAEELADEVRHQRYLEGPNPWLKPGDVGYVDPEVAEARRLAGDPDPYRRGR